MKMFKYGIIAFLCLYTISCGTKLPEYSPASADTLAVEKENTRALLITPLRLNSHVTEIHLGDFISDVDGITDITLMAAQDYTFSKEQGKIILDARKFRIPPMSILRIESKDETVDVPLISSEKKSKTISHRAAAGTKSVQIVGDFNGWTPEEMKNMNGYFSYSNSYDPGTYAYQLVIDGSWRTDPQNQDSISNGFGAYNSVLKIAAPDPSKVSQINARDFNKATISLNMKNPSKSAYIALWNNELIDEWTATENHSRELSIPNQASEVYRSHIRIYGYSNFGRANDVLIPLEFGKVISDPKKLDRFDKHTQILYFMMVDRFFNGDTTIDDPIEDERVDFRANYQGGDLEGIYQKLNEDYFQELGVNTIWLSPITQNPLIAYQEYPEPRRYYSGYHGYWPINNKKVDHRLGDGSTLKKVVSRAHREDMNILLDFVSNHVHEDHAMYQNDKSIATELDLADGRKNLRLWDGDTRLTTWFDTFMPSLNLEDEALATMMADTALYWIDEYDLDGFRHDATKHIPLSYWRLLTQKLKAGKMKEKSIYQVGETFGNRELIGSYVGSGMLDGQFDFNLYFDARDILAKENTSFMRLKNSLESSLAYYGHHSMMANLSGNHDLPRFIAYASEALSYEEDPKEAGWSREVTIKNPVGYDRLALLHAFNMTVPGIPVIYYGDEIGMVGANDPDNRRMMRFTDLTDRERALKAKVSTLTKLRRSSMSLLYGDTEVLLTEDNLLVYKRSYFNEESIVVLNKSPEERILLLDIDKSDIESFLNEYGIRRSDSSIEITIPAYDYEVISKR